MKVSQSSCMLAGFFFFSLSVCPLFTYYLFLSIIFIVSIKSMRQATKAESECQLDLKFMLKRDLDASFSYNYPFKPANHLDKWTNERSASLACTAISFPPSRFSFCAMFCVWSRRYFFSANSLFFGCQYQRNVYTFMFHMLEHKHTCSA